MTSPERWEDEVLRGLYETDDVSPENLWRLEGRASRNALRLIVSIVVLTLAGGAAAIIYLFLWRIGLI